MNHNSQILIVGAGAFGISTAYHLAQRGYTNIRVLDRHPIPSCEAASTDISKIIRSDYNERLYARLAVEAIQAWQTSDLFRGLYHCPGWVLSAKRLSVPFVRGSIKTSRELGVCGVEELTRAQLRQRFPMVNGSLDDWNILVWNPTAGWVDSGEALRRLAREAEKLGVRFVCGGQRGRGDVRDLIFSQDEDEHKEDGHKEDGHNEGVHSEGEHNEGDCDRHGDRHDNHTATATATTTAATAAARCKGVVTADGTHHFADTVILAAGAWMPSLIDLKGQLIAKGHSVAHIQLTPAEHEQYKDMPILDNLEMGYFFPPTTTTTSTTTTTDTDTNTNTSTNTNTGEGKGTNPSVLKLAHSQFLTNTTHIPQTNIHTSLPHTFHAHPADDLPPSIERTMRANLRRVLPALADRPFCYTRLCWDADTADRHFLITPHPRHAGLVVAGGGSAHAFKFMPVLGGYIADLIEGKLGPEIARVWAWRDGLEHGEKRGDLAHLDPEVELGDLDGWRGRRERESKRKREGLRSNI